MDNNIRNKKQIIHFTLNELKKTIDALKTGKQASVSPNLKKIFQMLKTGNDMLEDKKITEEDMDKIVDAATSKIEEKK